MAGKSDDQHRRGTLKRNPRNQNRWETIEFYAFRYAKTFHAAMSKRNRRIVGYSKLALRWGRIIRATAEPSNKMLETRTAWRRHYIVMPMRSQFVQLQSTRKNIGIVAVNWCCGGMKVGRSRRGRNIQKTSPQLNPHRNCTRQLKPTGYWFIRLQNQSQDSQFRSG